MSETDLFLAFWCGHPNSNITPHNNLRKNSNNKGNDISRYMSTVIAIPAKKIRWHNADSMLACRLWRLPNIEPALGQHHVFAGMLLLLFITLNFWCITLWTRQDKTRQDKTSHYYGSLSCLLIWFIICNHTRFIFQSVLVLIIILYKLR